MVKDRGKVMRSILVECSEDDVGLWSIIRDVRYSSTNQNPKELRSDTLDIIHELLRDGLIQAGYPDAQARKFQTWDLSPEEVVKRIEQEWLSLERNPEIGEIVWFITTEKGDREVRQHLED